MVYQKQLDGIWFSCNRGINHALALVAAPCPDSFLGPRLGGEDLCLLADVTLASSGRGCE